MFKNIDEYYGLQLSTRKEMVKWFNQACTVLTMLKAEGYEEDAIIKMMRSVITKKNIKYLDN